MPIYEYVNVEDSSDVREMYCQYADERPNEITLNGKVYKYQISVPGRAKFKGSGFYETDYK